MDRIPRLFVLSGPSGAGKGTVLAYARKKRPELHLTVSATTRQPRAGETDGVSYHFISDEEFTRLVDEHAFLEWADVHGHRYGTLWDEVRGPQGEGRSVILEIDVQGAFNVRKECPDAVLLFVLPPSMEELERRLRSRGTEDEKQILLRLANARGEMAQADRYDEQIVNDVVEDAAERLLNIIDRYETNGGFEDHGSYQTRD